MSDESKEWVTIKIPEAVRNDARDDERTYGQIMLAGMDTHALKTKTGGLDVDDLRAVAATTENLTALRSDLIERLERIEAAASTVEERTGSIERQLDDMGGR